MLSSSHRESRGRPPTYSWGTGALHVATVLGELVDSAPYVYQVINGHEVDVDGAFELVDAQTYTFRITGPYDSTVELVIDPELAWSTYLGGNDGPPHSAGGWDYAHGIAVDAVGNVLVTGDTWADDYPSTTGAFDRSLGGDQNAFITKLTNRGSLEWSTYLGGNDSRSISNEVAVDATGNVLVTGWTWSDDFPTTAGAFDRSLGGDQDAFVTKLTSSGMFHLSNVR